MTEFGKQATEFHRDSIVMSYENTFLLHLNV